MLVKIKVTDSDISYAESILLPAGKIFDEERRSFICNMETMDLQAVPGSGKTTALMAKLLIIERYLPLPDSQGIVVISHTNAAIDEIKKKIESKCPLLFSYPNFVGTIQSFTNEFLATPYFENAFSRNITRIDDDAYHKRFARFREFYPTGVSRSGRNNAINWLSANAGTVIKWTDNGSATVLAVNSDVPLTITKPRNGVWTLDEIAEVKVFLEKFKLDITSHGYLLFDEAYTFAKRYIYKFPEIIEIIQSRFAYCFVDEMQDMVQIQYSLLEDIFYAAGKSSTVYQRIGDKNQSIYIEDNSFWIDRQKILHLSGSHRLTKELAAIVKQFTAHPLSIIGRRELPNSRTIKPHLIIYNDSTIKNVIPFFEYIIDSLITSGDIEDKPTNKYHAIGWTEKPNARDKHTRLNSYRSEVTSLRLKNPARAISLLECFQQIDISEQDFSVVEMEVTSTILRLLQEENILDDDGYPFTKTRLHNNLRRNASDFFEEHKETQYECCLEIIEESIISACTKFEKLFSDLLGYFGKERAITNSYFDIPAQIAPATPSNTGKTSKINISSVHSVKGETHTCTLYLETFYQKNVGNGNYESERLKNQFDGLPVTSSPHSYVLQSLKMVYVGFSRPTHLLCFAVHTDRANALLTQHLLENWNVVQVI